MSFWNKLQKPFFVLAPMADVTDAPFRRLIADRSSHVRRDGSVGGPDVTWTEFVSADGLARAPEEGRKKLLADLIYTEAERPIVAQLFSSVPEHMEAAARLCRELGFDGIDINMGCPDRSIEKQGCGAAMIKSPETASAVIEAAIRGAEGLPVSVKTRVGYNKDELDTWLPHLLSHDISALTVHARTRKEMSLVPARWERVARAVELRDAHNPGVLLIGNGDAASLEDARTKASMSGADGVMLGRAIFGNPWLFHPEKDLSNITLRERFATLIEHTKLFEELLPHKNFAIMKKHYKAYVNGFDGAKELRMRLMDAKDAEEVEDIAQGFLDQHLELR
jgi:nifR3 family TIM-barrel protein